MRAFGIGRNDGSCLAALITDHHNLSNGAKTDLVISSVHTAAFIPANISQIATSERITCINIVFAPAAASLTPKSDILPKTNFTSFVPPAHTYIIVLFSSVHTFIINCHEHALDSDEEIPSSIYAIAINQKANTAVT